ncbi:MAG TPA: hypothetical protein VGK85_13920 [Myxococcaceae bacterium]|jgi:hypothetical protein
MEASRPADTSRLDPWTVGAIAVVAYALSNVIHEALGHGGACIAVGGHPRQLTAVFFDGDLEGLPRSAARWVAAGGSLANLVAAAIASAALRLVPAGWGRGRFFLWLILAVNLLQAFGYLMFSGLGGIGDWAEVVRDFQPAVAWRLLLTAAGAVLYFMVAPRWIMPWLAAFVPADREERTARVRRLTVLPYLVGGVTFVLAGVLNPLGWVYVLISAVAASFGGTSLLAWYPGLWARRTPANPPAVPLGVPRSPGWLVAAGIVLVLFVGVLGPGIPLGPGR